MKNQKEIIDVTKSTLPTLSSRAMFWRPKYLSESCYVEHIPFYFWLVEAQQTKLAFEPDICSGSSYFAICQAVDKLNLDSRCYATIADNCEGLDRIETYNHQNYREFSFIQDETVKDALYDLEDDSIDMLVLEHDSELLRNKGLMDLYLEKLSDEAIVLIQGSKRKEIKPLCRKLKESYKTFEFDHGGGLLVVCYGENLSGKVLSLVSHKSNEAGSRVIQNIYSRLGAACRESWLNSISQKQLEELNKRLELRNEGLIEKSDCLGEKEREIEKLKEVISDLKSKGLLLEVERQKLEKGNKEFDASNKISMLQIQQLQEELELVCSKSESLTNELREAKSREDHLEKELGNQKDKYASETFLLTKQVREIQGDLEKECHEKHRLQSELSALNEKLEKLKEVVSDIKSKGSLLEVERQKLEKGNKEFDASNKIAMLQIQQLQEELELVCSKSESLTNELREAKSREDYLEKELGNQKDKYASETLLLTTQARKIQDDLEKECYEKRQLQSELTALNEKNDNLASVNKKIKAELEFEKARQDQFDKEKKSSLKVENEIAMLQIQQLQEELECYFNKYQDQVKSNGSNTESDLSAPRFEHSLRLSKLIAS